MEEVVIVGGGIAGIAAAVTLRRAGMDPLLIERQRALGGKAQSLHVDGRIVERGPQTLSGDVLLPLLLELDVVTHDSAAKKARFLVRAGKLRKLAPSPLTLAVTRALRVSEKSALIEEAISRKRHHPGARSLRALFVERFGIAFTDHVAEAAVAGVYAGDLAKLGAEDCFPELMQRFAQQRSLVRAAMSGTAKRGIRVIDEGFSVIGDATRRHVRAVLEKTIRHVRRTEDSFVLGDEIRAKRVIWATEAHTAASALRGLDETLTSHLGRVRYEPLAVVSWRSDDLTHAPRGFGCLAAPSEGLRTLGTVFVSDIRGETNVRRFATFIGGAHQRAAVEENDDTLTARVAHDAKALKLGRVTHIEHIERYNHAVAQPDIGHRVRMQEAVSIARSRGLFLIGSYTGAGTLRDAAESGIRAANAILGRAHHV
jgi:protoporphyrinogen/coproporphyrinogen III oxidase